MLWLVVIWQTASFNHVSNKKFSIKMLTEIWRDILRVMPLHQELLPVHKLVESHVFSITGFYPRLVLAFGYCRCLRLSVCVCVTVCVCVRQPRAPNLDKRCKTTWLRSLLFLFGVFFFFFFFFFFSEFTLFWACPQHNSLPIQARLTKFGLELQNSLVMILIVLSGNWLWLSRSNLT